MFEELYHDEIIDQNPQQGLRTCSTKPENPNRFSGEEVTKILNELTGQAKNLTQFSELTNRLRFSGRMWTLETTR